MDKNCFYNFYKANSTKIMNQKNEFVVNKKKTAVIFSFFVVLLMQIIAYQKTYAQTTNLQKDALSWEIKPSEVDSEFLRKWDFDLNTQSKISQKEVRIIYLVPSDKNVRDEYKAALTEAVSQIQDFYRRELGNGFTFSLHSPVVEVYQTPNPSSWYATNSVPNNDRYLWFYLNLIKDGFPLSGGNFYDPNNRWIYFIDADSACDQISVGGAGGIAIHGATVLRGLTMQAGLDPCPDGQPEVGRRNRTIGGIAHEMGHAFNLPHPPGCGESGPNQGCTGGAFAQNSLMWIGYFFYPNTYFLPEDKQTLLNSDFFSSNCVFSLSSTSQSFNPAGGSNSFILNTGSGCSWMALSNAPWLTVTSGGSGSGNGTVNYSVASNNTTQSRTGIINVGGQNFTVNQSGVSNPLSNSHKSFDFDGDGKADISVFRPDNGAWYLLNSQSGFSAAQFGIASDKVVPADYDGDGKTDIAVYRGGTWYLMRSQLGFTGYAFGDGNDIPQPANFDGDGKAEIAVYRPSNGTWYVFNLATNQFSAYQFGASTDKPVVGDYDGDNKADYAVYRPSNGTWYIQRSTAGFTGIQFGDSNDKPVPADYDGDGKTDVAIFRPSNGAWYLLRSQLGFTGVQFGISSDLPTPADYDGDGKADIAVFRSGVWYLNRTTAGFTGVQFGAGSDKPVPNAFVP